MSRHSRSYTESHASIHSMQDVQDAPPQVPSDRDSQAFTSQQTLSNAVWERRGEYTRPDTVRIKIGTWNVASKSGTEKDVAGWFVGGQGVSESLTGLSLTDDEQSRSDNDAREGVDEQERRRSKKHSTLPKGDKGSVPGGSDVGIYVLGLQEVIDINSATEALKPYTDPAAANRFKKEVQAALPTGYTLIAERQLLGLLLLIWASPVHAENARSISTTSVGTGIMGYMGNKGAVTARLVIGESTRLVFVNSHMSAGSGKADLDRRNWDAEQILSRTRFDPIVDSLGVEAPQGEKIGDEDFAFWFGDMNYRLEGIPGDDVRRLLMLHTRNEYDIGSKAAKPIEDEIEETANAVMQRKEEDEISVNGSFSSRRSSQSASANGTSTFDPATIEAFEENERLDPASDPMSLQTTLNSLLPHDELHQQIKTRKAFHDGWQEGPITFLPTYKYDVGSVGKFDSSDKKRGPGWCDRIIFRTRKDIEAYYNRLKEEAEARKRDEDLKAAGIDKAAEDESTLFDYDPDADGYAEGDDEVDVENATESSPTKVTTKEGYEDILALEYYLSHQRVLSSDHKPLEAIFTLKYDAIIPELKAKVHQEVARELDRAENEGRPVITIVFDSDSDDESTDGIQFGEIRYKDTKVRSMTVANNGRVTAHFGFVNRPVGDDNTLQPTTPWLALHVEREPEPVPKRKKSVNPEDWSVDISQTYAIEPGDTCSVVLTANVNDRTHLREFNAGEEMEDVLVLRVKDGRDHFIPVHASWQQSIYGRTIDKLSKIPEGGVRALQRQQPKANSNDRTDANAVTMWSAPREIYRLTADIESLSERLLAEWSMLATDADEEPPWTRVAGWPFAPASWTIAPDRREQLTLDAREALDTDQPFDKCWSDDSLAGKEKVQIYADVLISLLDSLEDGVVTKEIWARLETDFFAKRAAAAKEKTSAALQSNDDRRAVVLEILAMSRPHSVAFVLLTSMLGHLAQEISNALQDAPAWSEKASSNELVLASPCVIAKRKSLDVDINTARRQLIKINYAAIFADAIFRIGDEDSKRWRESEEKRREIVGIFLGD